MKEEKHVGDPQIKPALKHGVGMVRSGPSEVLSDEMRVCDECIPGFTYALESQQAFDRKL
jgi:hypothetical protein